MPETERTPDNATSLHGLGPRIFLAVLLPTLMAFGFAAWLSFNQLEYRQHMYRLSGLVGLADACLEVAHALQAERGLTVIALAASTPEDFEASLDTSRREVNDRLEALFQLPIVERMAAEESSATFPQRSWATAVTDLRSAIDSGRLDVVEASNQYTERATRFIGCLAPAQETLGQATIIEELEDIQFFSLLKDSAGLERAFGAAYIANAATNGDIERFRAHFLTQSRMHRNLLDKLEQFPDPHFTQLLSSLKTGEVVERLHGMREHLLGGNPERVNTMAWFEQFSRHIDRMRAAERSVMERLHDEAADQNRAAAFNLWKIILLAIGLPVAVCLISFGIARHLFSSFQEQQRNLDRIRFLGQKDPLTGLNNRTGFHQAVTEAFARLQPTDSGFAALLLIDVNDFTDVNRVWGERTGDLVLELIGKRIQSTLPDNAITGRIYGDHFAAFLPTVADSRILFQKMSSLCEHLEIPYQIGERSVPLRTRVTASLFPEDGTTQEQLTRNAELARQAMIRDGKASGARLFDREMQSEADSVRQLTEDLRGAIESEQFQLRYQPRIETATRRIVGMEALLRWQHPEHGFIPPDRFIPLAEAEGLIVDIGEWVINETCRQVTQWREAGYRVVPISVNLSAVQFFQADLVSQIRKALRKSDVPPKYLQMELTETSLMADHERAASILDELHRLGVLSAIDDFGTGYSSLSYLRRFAIHFLKIDKSFVSGLPDNRDSSAIVDAVIGLAHRMGLKVVAEGVENEQQLAWLDDRHCDEVQGYHFSRPQPAEQIVAWLDKNQDA